MTVIFIPNGVALPLTADCTRSPAKAAGTVRDPCWPQAGGSLRSLVPAGRTQHGDAGRGEVVAGAEHGVPGPLGERVREAVAEVERGWMPSLAVSPPPAHRTGRQLLIDGDDVDLRIAEKPVDDILPGRPEAGLDDDAQLNPVFKLSRPPG